MAKTLSNPNPIVISDGKLKQVSDQLRGHTFCGDCEQMLSEKGEKWVLANVPEDYGSPFPLQDVLISKRPVFINHDLDIYEGRKINLFKMDQLIYFGMSIFWRGATREWKSSLGRIAPPVDLGEQYETMRQFLLGGPFPDVVILVLIHNLKPTMNIATTVLKTSHPTGDFYWFYLNGLGYKLYLDNIPNAIRQLCAHHSPGGLVIMDRGFGRMVREFAKGVLTSSELSPKLENFLKGPDPRKKS